VVGSLELAYLKNAINSTIKSKLKTLWCIGESRKAMKNNLATKGLSLSQASSISNLCFQRANEISKALSGINNATRTFKIGGETYTEQVGKRIPSNVAELLQEKSKLHAAQAFLMTNIKAKDLLLGELKSRSFVPSAEAPLYPTLDSFKPVAQVDEAWGWDQLSQAEYSEYLEQEAYASHIGQFIHKGSVLDRLRDELPKVKSLDWIHVKEGERTPVKVEVHHTSDELLTYHEQLAALHRAHEQRVNYFKAKVKNLVTEENARIAKENALGQAEVNKANEALRLEYTNKHAAYLDAVKVEREQFEAARQAEIQGTSALRISVDPRFQETIDRFLKQLDPEA
jgi:hypothetical protein